MTSQQVIPSVPKRSTMPVTSYSLGSKTDFVAVKKHSSMIETSALSKKSLRKERLPGSSWLKCSSRGANEIVLGAPVSKIDRKKRDNLPGSGWLLSKSHHSPQKGKRHIVDVFHSLFSHLAKTVGQMCLT